VSDLRGRFLVALRIAVAVVLAAGVGALAHLPFGDPPDEAALRIALRTPHAQVETCRDRSDEELSALPRHMRQRRLCEVTTVDYHLRVEVDGRTVVDRTVVHRGVRHNRPLVADELLPVAPGSRRVLVRFAPVAKDSIPVESPDLVTAFFDESVDFTVGRVRILALDPDGESFRLSG